MRGDGLFLVGPSARDDGIGGDGDFTGLIPAAEGVDARNVVVCILDFNRAGIGVGGVNGVGGVMRDSGPSGKRHTLGSVGPFILDGVLLQCHFTGGDGEVDGDIILVAILDRQGRGTVEGVVATVLLGIDCRGVDLDGVGLGVGVSGGGVAFGAVDACCLIERIKIPFDGSVGDFRRGHAGRQRVVDRAAGKTGGDIFGDRVESVLQPSEVTSRVGLAGGNIVVQIVEETDIYICVRIRHFLVGSTKANGVERSSAIANRCSCIRSCLENLRATLLAVTFNAGVAKQISRHIVRRLTVGQSNNVLGANSLNISFCK